MPSDTSRAGQGNSPPGPWSDFLEEVDGQLTGTLALHCLGGFVVTQLYGIGRATSDIDYLIAATRVKNVRLEEIAGMQSPLHRRYGLYMQHVGIATVPADYAGRLVRMFPGAIWKHLTLYALEANDLALSKLERNAERDREDVLNLARAGHLNREILRDRYWEELRPYFLSRQEWHDKTLDLWIDMCWPA